MARFFVGQRVRIVSASAHPELVGLESRITGVAFGEYLRQSYDWIIQIHGEPYGACSENLEPITPPHVAGSWEAIEQLLPNIREGVAA